MKFIIKTIFTSFVIFLFFVLSIIYFPHNTFYQSYDSLIQDKYSILMKTNDPKIIIVAGSNCAYGLDQRMLEEATKYKVANLGLHAGLGNLFISELAKQNIRKDDIVLLAYEYGWEMEDGFKKVGVEHVMAGLDDNLSMYSSLLFNIPFEIWEKCLGYLFDYAQMKYSSGPYEGVYSRSSFDPENAQMVLHREPEIDMSENWGKINFDNIEISPYSKKYLSEFKNYVEERGARVYFVSPPLLKDVVQGDSNELYKYKELVEKETQIKYISNPAQYLFPYEWMYNTIYHCNSIGEKERTKLLIEDLKRSNIV